MSSPLLFGAVLGGAYFLYKQLNKPSVINASSAPKAATSFASADGLSFGAQLVENGTADVFLLPAGTRIVRFDPATKRVITMPPGTDASILASAIKAFGLIR